MNSFLDELKNAFKRKDNALMQIIVINLIVFLGLGFIYILLRLFELESIYTGIFKQFSVPASLNNLMYRPWTLITYSFTHEGFFHILFNLLFLYWFGRMIVEYLGNKRLISLYVTGALTGAVFYLLLYNLVPRFAGILPNAEMIGASGAVYAIVVGAATLMPNYTIHLLLLGPVRIKYIAIFYVLSSFIELPNSNAGGNAAHLGGALMGYLYIVQLRKGRDLGAWVNNFLAWTNGLFSRKPKMKVTYINKQKVKSKVSIKQQGGSETMGAAKPNQAEIDKILDKISESGYESLSKEEKQKLFDASRS